MKKIYYHGTSVDIEEVDLNHSRIDIDFGPGFYLTEEIKKWLRSGQQEKRIHM